MTKDEGAGGKRPVWTILPLLERAEQALRGKSCDEPRLGAELLLAHVLGVPRLGLYLAFDRPLKEEELEMFRGLLRRRMSREPVQYILGETEFMGLRLEVNPSVLIPRPETEELVEEALRWLKSSGRETGRILEIGTGSGNIAAALGKFLPGARITSLEKSASALEVAQRNCRRHDLLNVELHQRDFLLEGAEEGGYDAVVTNPPYIGEEEFSRLQPEVREFEPRTATEAGRDGLLFIRAIVRGAPALLARGGALFMEIGDGQSEAALALAREAGLTGVSVKKDFAGIGRILCGFVPEIA